MTKQEKTINSIAKYPRRDTGLYRFRDLLPWIHSDSDGECIT